MNPLKSNMKSAGYDQEEAYFFEQNQELIRKQRERPKLELIQGGLSKKPTQPTGNGTNPGNKKAA